MARRTGYCTFCDKWRTQYGHLDLCSACYTRWLDHGKPAVCPPPTQRVRRMSERIITCTSCGRHEPQHGQQPWCHACWNRWDRAGRPDTGPPPRTTGLWDQYRELTRGKNYTPAEAAKEMGISIRTAERYEARITGRKPRTRAVTTRPDDGIIDPVAIARACAGEPLPLTPGERFEAVKALAGQGKAATYIAKQLHLSGRTARRLFEQVMNEYEKAA